MHQRSDAVESSGLSLAWEVLIRRPLRAGARTAAGGAGLGVVLRMRVVRQTHGILKLLPRLSHSFHGG